MKITEHPIYKEVAEAYFDCLHLKAPWEQVQERRNLSFRASQTVDRDTAIAIIEAIVPGYNGFDVEQLANLPEERMVTIAREGSVCLYVKGKLTPSKWYRLGCSEVDYDKQTDETRLWWD